MQRKRDEASGRTMLMQHDAKGMLEDYRRKLEADASKHSRPTLMPLSANVPTFTPPAHYSHLIGCGCISCRQSELRWKWGVNLDVPHVPYQSSSQPRNGDAINAAAPEDRNATEIKKLTALVETLGEEMAQVRRTSEKRKVKSDKRKKELEQLRDANKIKRQSEVQDRPGDHCSSGEGELESLKSVNEINETQWSSSTLMDEVPSANMKEDQDETRPSKRKKTASRTSANKQASPVVIIPRSERSLWNGVPLLDGQIQLGNPRDYSSPRWIGRCRVSKRTLRESGRQTRKRSLPLECGVGTGGLRFGAFWVFNAQKRARNTAGRPCLPKTLSSARRWNKNNMMMEVRLKSWSAREMRIIAESTRCRRHVRV
ncbi:hypothetical protein LTR37_017590 [Vermiconidia calcicola]|uniref:Uncharacterized protein n=1 Tax=Vermiconidia calcicola TaxID=1690605 RepID=A0ACC3ML22_9PEZI|nr:hypothetical protein LTR37_017590 [Vermiconidia calcicola]